MVIIPLAQSLHYSNEDNSLGKHRAKTGLKKTPAIICFHVQEAHKRTRTQEGHDGCRYVCICVCILVDYLIQAYSVYIRPTSMWVCMYCTVHLYIPSITLSKLPLLKKGLR
jgi:hypothetical protein